MQHKKYWCPTHPEVQSDTLGTICTQCGTMVLIPNPNSSHTTKAHRFSDFLPLLLMVSITLLITTLLSHFLGTTWSDLMRYFMGSFFLVFGSLKVIKLKQFAAAYAEYDLLAMRSSLYAHSYPALELLLALAYLTNTAPLPTNITAFILMLIGALGVYRKLKQNEEIPCACLGMVFKVPMTWVTLIEDLLMSLMALVMTVSYVF